MVIGTLFLALVSPQRFHYHVTCCVGGTDCTGSLGISSEERMLSPVYITFLLGWLRTLCGNQWKDLMGSQRAGRKLFCIPCGKREFRVKVVIGYYRDILRPINNFLNCTCNWGYSSKPYIYLFFCHVIINFILATVLWDLIHIPYTLSI